MAIKYLLIRFAVIVTLVLIFVWVAGFNFQMQRKNTDVSNFQNVLFPLRVSAADFRVEDAAKITDFQNVRITITPIEISQISNTKLLLKGSNISIILPTRQSISSGSTVEIVGSGRVVTMGKRSQWEFERVSAISVEEAPSNSLLKPFMELISRLQLHLANTIEKYLAEPHASLLTGILLGLNRSMPEDFYQNLIKTGTLHVIAASGFNITVIAKVLIGSFNHFFHKRVAILLSLLGILVYTLLAGASPAIVRAAIMGGLAFIAQAIGKEYLAKWTLVITGSTMLLMWPSNIESVSFWLSVTATGGILWFSPSLQRWFEQSLSRVNQNNWLVKSGILSLLTLDLSTTLSAQLGTLPIMVIVFGQFSLVSLFVNPLLLWLVPLIMAVGGLKLAFGLIFDLFGYVLAILAWIPLQAFIVVVNLASKTPFAFVSFTPMAERSSLIVNLIGSICYYLILFVLSKKLVNPPIKPREMINDTV